jgi:hypothetical protein
MIQEVNEDDFNIQITQDSLIEGRLHIHLEEHPDNIRIIDYQPKIAEYIIIK